MCFSGNRGGILPEAERIGNVEIQVSHNPPGSAEMLRHQNVVAGNLDGHLRSARSGAGLQVTEVAVKMGKGRARADDTGVYGGATNLANKSRGGVQYDSD